MALVALLFWSLAASSPAVISTEPSVPQTVGELADLFAGRRPGWRIVIARRDSAEIVSMADYLGVSVIVLERSLERAELSGRIRPVVRVADTDALVEQILQHPDSVGFVSDRLMVRRLGRQLYIWQVLR